VIRALLKLTWLEIKIFAREPLGLFGSLAIPIIVFLGLRDSWDRPCRGRRKAACSERAFCPC
jgi:hypothetical protein